MSRVDFDEPTIPARLRRPLAAAWISIGLHAALIALIQVAPPTSRGLGPAVIEARLVSAEREPAQREKTTVAPGPEQAPAQPAAPPPVLTRPEKSPASVAAAGAPPRPPAAAPSEPTPLAASAPPAATPSTAPPSAGREARAPAAPLAVTSAVDLTYYSARELDVQPRALREIIPTYPAAADRSRLSGKVRLQIELEADGRVRDVSVVSASPPEVFDESAVAAFREARFAPAQRNGRPVRARVLIEVVYDWEGRP